MRAIVKILYFFLLVSIEMLGQDYSIRGVIRDSIDNNPCLGANIKLFSVSLSPKTIFTTSDTKGYFQFVNIKPGSYILEISFIGFERFVDTIHIAANSINLGNILMRRSSVQLEQVEVLGNIIQAEQKEDTIQFLAKGFKVNKDATAEELITKIPGVIKEDGKIKTQGEDVKQILVDGKPFFGDDPDIVLKNLPAEVIEKIQVYDRMSDQAQFTGFDDGQASKTINIITRQDRQHGQFGKLYAGYGTDDRYLSGGNVNLFNQQRRISLIGLVNNINQQNFSAQDLLGISGNRGDRQFRPPGGGGRGFSGRGGGGETENFLVGGQEGNTNTYSFGFNFIDNLWNDLSINGSYFLNHTNNINDQSLTREYYSDPDNPQLYSENSAASSKNFNHRINMRAEYSIDSLNSFILTPKLYFQSNSSFSNLSGSNYLNTNLNNFISNSNNAENNGYNLSNELLIRHKFDLPGRTISLSVNTGINRKNTEKNILSMNEYFETGQSSLDTINQQTKQLTTGYNISSNLVYTEPVGEEAQVQASFNVNLSRNKSDKKTNSFNLISQNYDDIDSLLSNEYQNDYSTMRGGLSYRYRTDELNISAGVSYQHSLLDGNQFFPTKHQTGKLYKALLPNARVTYRFSESSNIRFNYFANTNPPSISQLQNTVDNTNSIFLSIGNPELKEEFSHRISLRYLNTNLQSGSSFFAMLFFNYIKNDVGNITINASKDTLLPSGVFLQKGSQLTYPINFNYSYSIRSFINAGFPVNFIKSNINFNTSLNLNLTPGQVNEIINYSKSYSIGQGIMISSNIGEDLDFRLSYTPTFYITRNNKQIDLNKEYFVHNASAGFYFLFFNKVFIRSDFAYYFNQGISPDLKREYFLVNSSIGIKLFENNSGEIRFDTFDMLDQNRSLNRTITESYIEDRTTIVLQRYFMLSFVYNLRVFGG